MKHTKLVFAIPLLFGMVLAQAAPLSAGTSKL